MQFVGAVLILLLIFLGIGKMIKLFLGFGGLVLLGFFWYYKNGSKEAAELLAVGEPEFELSKQEIAALAANKKELDNSTTELDELKGIKKLIQGKIQNMYQIGDKHDLRRRNDNYFDNRSAKGKELNQNIEELENDLSAAEGHIRDSERTINELTENKNKLQELPNDRRFYKTAQTVTLCLIGAYLVFLVYYFASH